jgi:alpha-tubulin suppressor-like RCC1 family protein
VQVRVQHLFTNYEVDVYIFQAVNTSGVLSGVTIVKAKMDGYLVIALSNTGELFSWGAITDRNGTTTVIGDGTTVYHEVPQQLSSTLFDNKTLLDFDVTQYNTMVLTSDGSVYSIGDGTFYLTGTANDTFQPIYSMNTNLASILLNNETVTQVHQGLLTSMVITNTGRVLIWGSNQDGALGIGNNNYSVVIQTPQSLTSCGGKTNFKLGCSGDVSFIGSIDNCTANDVPNSNTTTPTPTPTATSIVTSTTITPAIVPINASNAAVAIYGFGANYRGQLGDGTTISRATPTLILTNEKFSSITQGHEFTLGITTQGELYAWGRGDEGQLGDNSTVYHSQLTPRLVELSSVLSAGTLVKCVAGIDTVLCLSNNSVIVGWGNNSNGQISDGTTNQRAIPVLSNLTNVGVNVNISDIDMAVASSLLLTSNGMLFTCGSAHLGVLGQNEGAGMFYI